MIRACLRWPALLCLALPFIAVVAMLWVRQDTLQGTAVLGYGAQAVMATLSCLLLYKALPRFRLPEERRPWLLALLAVAACLVYQMYCLVTILIRHAAPLPWIGVLDLMLIQGLFCAALMAHAGHYPSMVIGKTAIGCNVLLTIGSGLLIALQLPIYDVLFTNRYAPLDRELHLGSLLTFSALLISLVLFTGTSTPSYQQRPRLVLLAGSILILLATGTQSVFNILGATPVLLPPVLCWGLGACCLMAAAWYEIEQRPKDASGMRVVEDSIPMLDMAIPIAMLVTAALITLHTCLKHEIASDHALRLIMVLGSLVLLVTLRMGVTLLWHFRAFTGLQAALRESEHLCLTDALTGVPNKRACMQRLEDEIARSLRYKRPVSLIFSDIDFFKLINDVHGHHMGDVALCTVAHLLQEKIRTTDMIARLGGEEFVIVLPETTLSQAALLADRLRKAVEDSRMPLENGGTLQMTISLGVSSCPETSSTVESLLDDADQAMNHAKDTGRNRVVAAQATQHLYLVDTA